MSLSQPVNMHELKEAYRLAATKATFAISDTFITQKEGRLYIKTSLLDHGLSWKVFKAEGNRTILVCRSQLPCNFRVRLFDAKTTGLATVNIFQEHTCPISTHVRFSEANATWYITRHQRHMIEANRKITPKEVLAVEIGHFQHGEVPYLQAYRAKQAVLLDMNGTEHESFGMFPDYIQRYTDACEYGMNFSALARDPDTDQFMAVFFAPTPLRFSAPALRPLLFCDRTHTFSQYKMILMVAMGLDPNGKGILLGYSLVPVKNEY